MMRLSQFIPPCIIIGSVLLIYSKTKREQIYPENYMVYAFSLQIIMFLTVMFAYILSENVYALFWTVSMTYGITNLIIAIIIIACVYQVMRFCEDGYESFTINGITGVVNLGVNISNIVGSGWLQTYVTNRHSSKQSFSYVCIFSSEYALIFLLLAVYFLIMKKSVKRRKGSDNVGTRSARKNSSGPSTDSNPFLSP